MQDATTINSAMDATPVAQLAVQVAELLTAEPAALRLEPIGAKLQSKLDALRLEWDSLLSEQQRLRETEARFMAFLRSSQDAVLLADPSGRIKTWNDGAERLFGLEGVQLEGRLVEELLEVPTLEEQSDYQITTIRMQGIHQNGSRFPADVSVASSPTPCGVVYTFMIRDVTGEESLKSQLLQAQRLEAIGSLATGVAHEINTPTQYVNDNVHFLQNSFRDLMPLLEQLGPMLEAAENGEAPEAASLSTLASSWRKADPEFLITEIPLALEQSLQGLARIAEIVRSMKALAHQGASQAKTLENLNEILQQTATISTGEWKYVAQLELQLDENLPPVLCLRNEISQVFLNLIVNAAHAIESAQGEHPSSKGTITVSTSCAGNKAVIRIADTGTGIPPEVQSRIFDPFFTTKPVGKGSGQGLTIAHGIVVEKHHGTLSFETQPGQGTTFVITLPLEKES